MKKDILKKVYFHNADDRDLEDFTSRFLSGGLFWIYIALHPEKQWKLVFESLSKDQKTKFISEYNKAFLFTRTYKEFTKLCLGRPITLKNLFLPRSAKISPESFIKITRSDELRWKEALELIS